jgi:hypothetical protein
MDLGLKVTTIFLKKLRTFSAHLFACTKPRPHGRGYITAGPSGLGQHSKPQYQLCPTVRGGEGNGRPVYDLHFQLPPFMQSVAFPGFLGKNASSRWVRHQQQG